jgi:DNA polymerase V
MKLHYLGDHGPRKALKLPLYLATVPAGFPSPADDYIDKRLDLNEHLIRHDAATFYCRVSGKSMEGIGIFDGDLLIVDRAVKPQHRSIVVANIDGEMACKILDIHHKQLLSANSDYAPICIGETSEFCIEGVVIHSIRSHACAG